MLTKPDFEHVSECKQPVGQNVNQHHLVIFLERHPAQVGCDHFGMCRNPFPYSQ